ncbi:MAG: iron-sulfur cluster assembly scaffold protein [Planctomycetes bacterium]|nr:iron-sulfur cluster assembly scaffold protein [Planctomycetota bacterium]
MPYSEKLVDHFENPRNVGSLDEDDPSVGTGTIGSPVCGDVMKLQIRVDECEKIVEVKFKTFGCASAIASGSLATEWLKGRSLDEALAIRNANIAIELDLPPPKVHCSVLAEDAIRAAVSDLKEKMKKPAGAAEQTADTQAS